MEKKKIRRQWCIKKGVNEKRGLETGCGEQVTNGSRGHNRIGVNKIRRGGGGGVERIQQNKKER